MTTAQGRPRWSPTSEPTARRGARSKHRLNLARGLRLQRVTALFLFIGACVPVVAENREAFAAQLTVNSALSVSERYNNNLYLSQTDPIGDLTTVVSPRVDLTLDQRSFQGVLRYQASGEWYHQRSEQNRLSHLAELEAGFKGLERLIRGLDVRLTASYSLAGELPGTSLSGQPVLETGVLLPQTDTTAWSGTMTAGYSWTRRVETRLAYAFRGTRFEAFNLVAAGDVVGTTPALLVNPYNSAIHDVTLELRYRLSQATTLTLNPGWTAVRVDPVETTPPTPTDTLVTGRLTVGAEYTSGPTFTFNGRIGVLMIEDDQTRLALDVGLQRSWTRGSLSLSAGQGSGAGGGVTGTPSVTRWLGADVSQSLGIKTQASFGLDFARNASLTIRVVTYGANAGLSRELVRWLTGRLDYTYLVQRSDGVALDGERHVVTVTLMATAPPWHGTP